MIVILPFLCLRCSVSLPSVFEPVADLRRGESRGLGQLSFLPRGWVRIVSVPLPENAPALLLEAVARLFSVPDGAGKGELSPDAVLPHGAERAASQLLRLDVVRFQPQLLQLRVVVRRKLVALQDLIELSEVPPVEGDHGFRFEDALIFVEVFARREGPEEAPQPLDVPSLLENFADTRHLFLRKTKRRKHGHGDNVNQYRLYCALLPRLSTQSHIKLKRVKSISDKRSPKEYLKTLKQPKVRKYPTAFCGVNSSPLSHATPQTTNPHKVDEAERKLLLLPPFSSTFSMPFQHNLLQETGLAGSF